LSVEADEGATGTSPSAQEAFKKDSVCDRVAADEPLFDVARGPPCHGQHERLRGLHRTCQVDRAKDGARGGVDDGGCRASQLDEGVGEVLASHDGGCGPLLERYADGVRADVILAIPKARRQHNPVEPGEQRWIGDEAIDDVAVPVGKQEAHRYRREVLDEPVEDRPGGTLKTVIGVGFGFVRNLEPVGMKVRGH
jgi:hypothetical protein